MTYAHPLATLLLAACLAPFCPASAQTPASGSSMAPAGAPGAAAITGSRTEQRIEHIRVEDSSARIDELRVGGETQSITVAPKGSMPPYEVIPASANRAPSAGERNSSSASGGTRVWKILGF